MEQIVWAGREKGLCLYHSLEWDSYLRLKGHTEMDCWEFEVYLRNYSCHGQPIRFADSILRRVPARACKTGGKGTELLSHSPSSSLVWILTEASLWVGFQVAWCYHVSTRLLPWANLLQSIQKHCKGLGIVSSFCIQNIVLYSILCPNSDHLFMGSLHVSEVTLKWTSTATCSAASTDTLRSANNCHYDQAETQELWLWWLRLQRLNSVLQSQGLAVFPLPTTGLEWAGLKGRR